MHPKAGSFSIVLLGSWNPSIFHQGWIINNLVKAGTENVTIAYPLDDPTAPRKISFEEISLFPGRKQILLQPDEASLLGLQKCAKLLSKIVALLSHTPLGACGINLTFEEENQLVKIYDALNLSDSQNIDAELYTSENITISRSLRLTDGNSLNTAVSTADGRGQVRFNFHYELNSAQAYQDVFTTAHMATRFEEAVTFCKKVYELDLEDLQNAEAN